jgi:hypothetical protein
MKLALRIGLALALLAGLGLETRLAMAAEPAAKALAKITSLSFERDTFETAVQILSDDIGVPMTIRGADLQLEGITKNQPMTLLEENKPAAEILKTILIKANPDGKLVYVILKNSAGEEEIQITTRVGAAKNKWAIPADMQLPPSTKKKKK